MTTIVGIQGDGYAVLCTDSRISSVDNDGYVTNIQTLASSSSKIAQLGNCLVGVAGDVRAINLIGYSFQPPQPSNGLKGRKLDEFVTNKFIPALRECFDNNGYSPPPSATSEHTAEHGSVILAAINSTIYQIDNDYAWGTDVGGLYAIGTGAAYAMGAMAVLCTNGQSLTQAKRNSLKAVAVAAKYDPHTGNPYKVYYQDETSAASSKRKTTK